MSTPDRRAERRPWSRADTLALTLVTLLAGALRGVDLSNPPFIYSDELFYAREACLYVYRSPATCGIPLDAISAHPPLGKWLISLGVHAFGWQPIGWRVSSLVAGTLTVALLYLLARRLLGSTWAATFAAGLLAIDFLHIVQSRIAMLDVFLTLFVVGTFLFVVLDRDGRSADPMPDAHGRPLMAASRRWLFAAGLAAGAAIATKWIGVLALVAVVSVWWVWAVARRPSQPTVARIRTTLKREWLAAVVAFIIAPAAVYTAASVPRIEAPVFRAPWVRGSWPRRFARVQLDMLDFHRHSAEIRYVGITNPYASPAWSWPLIKRPMTYYSAERAGDGRVTIRAMGNPLTWWASLAALFYLALRLARRRWSDPALVAVVGFGVMYVPLLLVSRTRAATFIYYMLPSVPFMCLALATVLAGRYGRVRRRVSLAFSVGAVALLGFFYPVLTGVPLAERELEARDWFRNCRVADGIAAPAGWCWQYHGSAPRRAGVGAPH